MRRDALLGIAVAVGIVAIVGAVAIGRWTPTVPVDAATTVVATTNLTGPVPPDATGADGSDSTAGPAASECLPSIDRAAGPLSLCYEAFRIADADAPNDYYRLRLYGTYGGEQGSGVRWAVIRARLVGVPVDNVFEAEPSGDYHGVCVPEGPPLEDQEPMTVGCGDTTAGAGPEPWSQQVAWTCTGCLTPDHRDRAIWLTEMVKVKGGTLPTWEIFADLGS